MHISKIICNGDEVQELNYFSKLIFIYGLELAGPEGDEIVADCKFALPEIVKFMDKNNKSVDFQKIINSGYIEHNGKRTDMLTDQGEIDNLLGTLISRTPLANPNEVN